MNNTLSGASMHDVSDNDLVNAIPATCQWNYIGNTFVKTVYIDQGNEFHTFTFKCVKTKVAWDLAIDIREIYVPTTYEWFASNIQGLVTHHNFGVLKESANLIDLSKDLFTQDFGMTYDVCAEICNTYFDNVNVSTSLFTAFELTLTRNTNGHFIVGLLKQTEYIVANGQFRPKITWFSLAAKNLGNMPYYTGSKTFGDIVSFAKANLNSNTSEPNL